MTSRSLRVYLNIARDVAWLISKKSPGVGLERLAIGCAEIMRDGGFTTPAGWIKIRELARELRNAYPEDLLTSLQCEIEEHSTKPNWVDHFISRLFKHRCVHPLRFLLFAQFFGLSAQAFVQRCKAIKEQKPRGDTVPRGRRITYEAAWESALRQMWSQDSLSLTDIGKKLGTSRSAVKSLAVRMGLAFPRLGPYGKRVLEFGSVWKPENKTQLIRVNREKWLTAASAHPTASPTQLKKSVSGVHKFLWTYDKEWLREHMPSPRPRISKPQKDWTEIDLKLEEDLRRAAGYIRQMDGCPLRITKRSLARHIGCKPRQLQSATLVKMPQTMKTLNSLLQPYAAFALRRIRWATYWLKEHGESRPTSRDLLKRAQLRTDLIYAEPELRTAVHSALGFLRDPTALDLDVSVAA
jgi:hypothetical protein